MTDIYKRSLIIHEQLKGKLSLHSKLDLDTKEELSIAYTPGVAEPCRVISENVDRAKDLTIKRNSVAIVSDGSAVLGLGNIGPEASIPVMEGKAILFKKYADIDAWPLCLNVNSPEEIIATVKAIAPGFGGVNLEDIAAPACFEIENALQDIGIPVFHDDQHGTAIVLLAAMINACKITGRKLSDCKIVINGAGAAGTAIAKLLLDAGKQDESIGKPRSVVVCDSKGAISEARKDLNSQKQELLSITNEHNEQGDLADILKGADVFIGVSKGGILNRNHVKTMAKNPFLFAMANPTPEIMPDEALAGGAQIMGTGRSDFPNQVNNVLAFPGIFRGALDAKAPKITAGMKLTAAKALANCILEPTPEMLLPEALDRTVAPFIARAVKEQAIKEFYS
jgi:malate dehydrogenase (oxaloacetate-decarboxylating)